MNTVNEALNIPMSTWDDDQENVTKALFTNDTISDALLQIGNNVKNDEFNMNDVSLSIYERRLLAVGYILGCDVAAHMIKEKLKENPAFLFEFLTK